MIKNSSANDAIRRLRQDTCVFNGGNVPENHIKCDKKYYAILVLSK